MKNAPRSGGVTTSRRAVLAATGTAAVAAVLPNVSLAAPAEKAFVGTYKHAGGDKEREARDKAIDDVVSGMNFIARPIARDRLKAANPIAATLAISSDATSLTITFDTRTYTAPLSGTSVKVKGITGDELQLSYKVSTGQIEQRFAGEGRGRVNTFTKSDELVVVDVRVHSTQLPKDLKYRLTYKKT